MIQCITPAFPAASWSQETGGTSSAHGEQVGTFVIHDFPMLRRRFCVEAATLGAVFGSGGPCGDGVIAGSIVMIFTNR